jgi:hypothetical protein
MLGVDDTVDFTVEIYGGHAATSAEAGWAKTPRDRLLGIPVLAGSGTGIAQTMWNIGVSAHIALLLECNAAEKTPGKEGGLHWPLGKECMNTKEVFLSLGGSIHGSFYFSIGATHPMYHARTARLKYCRRLCHT